MEMLDTLKHTEGTNLTPLYRLKSVCLKAAPNPPIKGSAYNASGG